MSRSTGLFHALKSKITRRKTLELGIVSFFSGLYIPFVSAAPKTDNPKKLSTPVPIEQTPLKDVEIIKFIEVSKCLTDRKTLNYATGEALYNALTRSNKSRIHQISMLHKLISDKKIKKASTLARVAEKSNPIFKDVIHEILLGWYRGVADGRVITFGSSLMFELSRDAVFPKTYAQGSPFYWKYQPPEVRVPSVSPSLSPSPLVIEPT